MVVGLEGSFNGFCTTFISVCSFAAGVEKVSDEQGMVQIQVKILASGSGQFAGLGPYLYCPPVYALSPIITGLGGGARATVSIKSPYIVLNNIAVSYCILH